MEENNMLYTILYIILGIIVFKYSIYLLLDSLIYLLENQSSLSQSFKQDLKAFQLPKLNITFTELILAFPKAFVKSFM